MCPTKRNQTYQERNNPMPWHQYDQWTPPSFSEYAAQFAEQHCGHAMARRIAVSHEIRLDVICVPNPFYRHCAVELPVPLWHHITPTRRTSDWLVIGSLLRVATGPPEACPSSYTCRSAGRVQTSVPMLRVYRIVHLTQVAGTIQ